MQAKLVEPIEPDSRMHLAVETGSVIQTKCGLVLNSCNYENFVLTECEEVFYKHSGESCGNCAAELVRELMEEEYLGG